MAGDTGTPPEAQPKTGALEPAPTNPPDPAQAQVVAALRVQQFTGPLPHPALLGGYDQVLPGSAERILKMAEKEQAHIHEMRSAEMQANARMGLYGQVCAVIIGVSSIVGAAWAPHASVGCTIATVGLGTLAVSLLGPKIAEMLAKKKAGDAQPDGKNDPQK